MNLDLSKPLQLTDGTPLTNVHRAHWNPNKFVADAPTAPDNRIGRVFRLDGTSCYGSGDAVYAAPAFDPKKPVQTRDGRKARILATDVAGPFPLMALVTGTNGAEVALTFKADGKYGAVWPCGVDLVNAPERREVYTNVYSMGADRVSTSELYDTVEGADEQHDRDLSTRLGMIALTLEDDKLVDAEFVCK